MKSDNCTAHLSNASRRQHRYTLLLRMGCIGLRSNEDAINDSTIQLHPSNRAKEE